AIVTTNSTIMLDIELFDEAFTQAYVRIQATRV
ncbi:MAG: hypothetical protein ACI915_005615, partial [Gammaproteobacteria bacterium]